MNKIEKYLNRLCKQYKVSDSGSEYYKIGNIKIRYSDHLAFFNVNELQIIDTLNLDTPTLICNNKIISFPTYSKVKEFIRNFILISKCMNIPKVQSENPVTSEKVVEKVVVDPLFDKTELDIIKIYRQFSPKKQKAMRGWMHSSWESKHEKNYRKQA